MATPLYETKPVTPEEFEAEWAASPSLTFLTNGDLLCAFSARTDEARRGAGIYAARIAAADHHWTHPVLVEALPPGADFRPVIFTGGYGTVWLSWIGPGGGTEPVSLNMRPSAENGHTWHTVQTHPAEPGWHLCGQPARIGDVGFLLPVYSEEVRAPFVLASDDDGRDWAGRGAIAASGQAGPAVLTTLKHRTVVALAGPGEKGDRLQRSVSRDAGNTWSVPSPLELAVPAGAADIVRLRNGKLVLAMRTGAEQGGAIVLLLSADEGRTWTSRRELAAGDEPYGDPAIVQGTNAALHVAYPCGRAIRHAIVNEEWIRGGR